MRRSLFIGLVTLLVLLLLGMLAWLIVVALSQGSSDSSEGERIYVESQEITVPLDWMSTGYVQLDHLRNHHDIVGVSSEALDSNVWSSLYETQPGQYELMYGIRDLTALYPTSNQPVDPRLVKSPYSSVVTYAPDDQTVRFWYWRSDNAGMDVVTSSSTARWSEPNAVTIADDPEATSSAKGCLGAWGVVEGGHKILYLDGTVPNRHPLYLISSDSSARWYIPDSESLAIDGINELPAVAGILGLDDRLHVLCLTEGAQKLVVYDQIGIQRNDWSMTTLSAASEPGSSYGLDVSLGYDNYPMAVACDDTWLYTWRYDVAGWLPLGRTWLSPGPSQASLSLFARFRPVEGNMIIQDNVVARLNRQGQVSIGISQDAGENWSMYEPFVLPSNSTGMQLIAGDVDDDNIRLIWRSRCMQVSNIFIGTTGPSVTQTELLTTDPSIEAHGAAFRDHIGLGYAANPDRSKAGILNLSLGTTRIRYTICHMTDEIST